MDKPVPPYLIAFAVGDLKFRSLGPRSGVRTEATMLDAARIRRCRKIDAASALYGPYRRGRYDMLVLPPPFLWRHGKPGCCILHADDHHRRPVEHRRRRDELAHSWSGNLVTNATWSDSWLNEGFTTYFENRIMEALYGKERAAMYADLDWDNMMRDIDANGGQTAVDLAARCTRRRHARLYQGVQLCG